ncbi:uncharacterized protein IWZ02DRAFT_492196 [Phyllosticta citriasiana]|uniref:uncharacterized protein n=1 Tax=Phyllosticta citriasiana TaxID=595635 RepID=UPI0030FDA1D8
MSTSGQDAKLFARNPAQLPRSGSCPSLFSDLLSLHESINMTTAMMIIPAFVYNGPGSLNKQQGKVAELRLELQSGGKKDKNTRPRRLR